MLTINVIEWEMQLQLIERLLTWLTCFSSWFHMRQSLICLHKMKVTILQSDFFFFSFLSLRWVCQKSNRCVSCKLNIKRNFMCIKEIQYYITGLDVVPPYDNPILARNAQICFISNSCNIFSISNWQTQW